MEHRWPGGAAEYFSMQILERKFLKGIYPETLKMLIKSSSL